MNETKKILGFITAAGLLIAGCGTPIEPPPEEEGFPQPENTVALSFTIDASGRPGFYVNEGLEWKGSFTYDKATRLLTYSADWAGGNGPYAPLYDDGPWDKGGHEPKGAVAGDNKFGITAFLPKQTEALEIKYGAQIPAGPNCGNSGGCWIWKGSDGSVTIPAGSTTPVTAAGLMLDPDGTNDLRLTLDTNNLGGTFELPAGTKPQVKGTFSDWSPEETYDDGTHGDATASDGIYTYTLSLNAIRRLKLASGANAEFIWVVGGVEYKDGSAGELNGVKAFVKGATGDFVEKTVAVLDSNQNTYVAIP